MVIRPLDGRTYCTYAMNNRIASPKPPNEWMQIETICTVVERPDHRCGDDLMLQTDGHRFSSISSKKKTTATLIGSPDPIGLGSICHCWSRQPDTSVTLGLEFPGSGLMNPGNVSVETIVCLIKCNILGQFVKDDGDARNRICDTLKGDYLC